MQTTKSPLDAARAVVSGLMRQLDDLETRALELGQEQGLLAYSAHVEGDAKAKKRLADIKLELASIAADMTSLRAAVDEADKRVAEAQGVERIEIERKKGEQALKLGTELRDHAVGADKALKDAFAHLGAMYATAQALSRLGAPPSPALVESGLLRALKSASMGTRFKLEHLAPTERHTVVELADRWGAFVEGWAAQRIGEAKVEEAA